jgi:hypothetical protein
LTLASTLPRLFQVKRWHGDAVRDKARAETAEEAAAVARDESAATAGRLREQQAWREVAEVDLEALRREQGALRRQAMELSQQLDNASRELDEKVHSLEVAREDAAAAHTAREEWQAHAAAADARTTTAAADLEARTQALATATAETLQLKRSILDATSQMEAAVVRAADGERELNRTLDRLHTAERQAADARDAAQRAVRDADEAALAAANLQSALAAAETQLTDVQLQGRVAEDRVRDLAEQLARSQAVASEVHELRDAMRELKEENGTAAEEATAARRAASTAASEVEVMRRDLLMARDELRQCEGHVASLRLEKGSLQALLELAQDDVKRLTHESRRGDGLLRPHEAAAITELSREMRSASPPLRVAAAAAAAASPRLTLAQYSQPRSTSRGASPAELSWPWEVNTTPPGTAVGGGPGALAGLSAASSGASGVWTGAGSGGSSGGHLPVASPAAAARGSSLSPLRDSPLRSHGSGERAPMAATAAAYDRITPIGGSLGVSAPPTNPNTAPRPTFESIMSAVAAELGELPTTLTHVSTLFPDSHTTSPM